MNMTAAPFVIFMLFFSSVFCIHSYAFEENESSKEEISILWNLMLNKESCLHSSIRVDCSIEDTVFASFEWKRILAVDHKVLAVFLVGKLKSKDKTAICLCGFGNVEERYIALYALQQLVRRNFKDIYHGDSNTIIEAEKDKKKYASPSIYFDSAVLNDKKTADELKKVFIEYGESVKWKFSSINDNK